MKYTCYTLFFIASTLFFACKKNQITPDETAVITHGPVLRDSVSFTINGQTFASLFTIVGDIPTNNGNRDANVKIDSIGRKNGEYYYSASKDSLLFDHAISMPVRDPITKQINNISVYMIKKYEKTQLISKQGVMQPKNFLELYAEGDYNYAIDFNRENSQNGVGLQLNGMLNGVDSYLTTYSFQALRYPTLVNKTAQAGSSFKIISFNTYNDGQYYFIAQFNATLFDTKDSPVKLTNGYMRFRLVM